MLQVYPQKCAVNIFRLYNVSSPKKINEKKKERKKTCASIPRSGDLCSLWELQSLLAFVLR
jgi:hypothetical protein